MNKKLSAISALTIILAFMVYIIYDAASGSDREPASETSRDTMYSDNWKISGTVSVGEGILSSVAVSDNGTICLAGDSFIKAVDHGHKELWSTGTEQKITALAVSGDTIFASTEETILVVSKNGKILNEWGPYEGNSIITSLSANHGMLAVADAGSKRVFILGPDGDVVSMLGQSGDHFIIPSPYFDLAWSGNDLVVANPGRRRVETWSTDGRMISAFGEPGTAPGSFCGCCNPSHLAVTPYGIVTAEKGINRVKILDREGHFIEFVSSHNSFDKSVPLDLAADSGKGIYAADNANSKLYIFERK
jgi:DNA-binding beta-propeller fold protein YncE